MHTDSQSTEPTALTDIPEQQAGYHAGQDPDASAALDLSCWAPAAGSANRDIIPSKDLIEGRALDVTQNDGYIAGSLQYHVDHAIGLGLKLSLRPDIASLGQDENWGAAFSNELETAFKLWTESAQNHVDVTGVNDWSSIQAVAYRSLLIHGEVLASYEPRRNSKGNYITKIRLIDPARLSDPGNGFNLTGKDVRGGIEYDADGRPIAYYISNKHPNDFSSRTKRRDIRMTWTRYPAFGQNGRRKIFHSFDPLRPEQSRGVTIFASVLRAVKMVDKVQDATLQAALLQTVFAIVVKSEADWSQIMEVMGAGGAEQDAKKTLQDFVKMRGEYYTRNGIDVNGAKAIHLLPDETLEIKEAKAANPEIGQFLDSMREEIARGQNMSTEQFTGNFGKINFSAARMSSIQSNKAHAGRRKRVMAPFCGWVFALFAEEYFLRNPSALPPRIDFYGFRDALLKADWQGPPMVDADPEKTAKAAAKRIEGGYTTMEYECQLLGLDWEEVLTQQARELESKKALGLFELQSENAASMLPPVPETPPNGTSSNDR